MLKIFLCTGNTSCKKGYQNTVENGNEVIDERHFIRVKTPHKVKISLSGCSRFIFVVLKQRKRHRIIGTPKGWRILVGWNLWPSD
jgi:NAD(P)H-nitrite reductase large subunit